jgi:hypothetical protein
MADLTPEDKENYGKLKDAFSLRSVKGDNKTPDDETLQSLVKLIDIGTIPVSTDQLSQKINSLDLYFKVLKVQQTPLEFAPANPNDNKEKLEQQLLDSFENLKLSLKVVEDEKVDLTDEIEEFEPEALFLEFIDQIEKPLTPQPVPSAKESTEKLINEIDPNLNEIQIKYLTNTWSAAVTAFVEDARKTTVPKKNPPDPNDKVKPRQPETFAYFFRIHKELEILYSRLADSETVQ